MRRSWFLVAICFALLSACSAREDCKLRYGGAGYFANFPEYDESKYRSEDYRFFAVVSASREKPGSLYDYQKKLFNVRVRNRSDETLLKDCIAIDAGYFDVDFEWQAAETLTIIFTYENESGAQRITQRQYLMDLTAGQFRQIDATDT